jgi:hypothetical protein
VKRGAESTRSERVGSDRDLLRTDGREKAKAAVDNSVGDAAIAADMLTAKAPLSPKLIVERTDLSFRCGRRGGDWFA